MNPNPPSMLLNLERNEQENIKALPSYMLRKRQRVHRFLPNRPHPEGFCAAHDTLHPYIVGSLLHKIQLEVTGPHFNMLIPLQSPLAHDLAESLKAINSYWTRPQDYARIFSVSPPRSVRFQENGCDACVLAAISGSTESLEALRTSSFSKRRNGGRVVGWLDRWLVMKGPGVRYEVQLRSEETAMHIRKLKCGKGSKGGKRKHTAKEKVKKDVMTGGNSKGGSYKDREGSVGSWTSENEEDEGELEGSWTSDIVDDYLDGWQ